MRGAVRQTVYSSHVIANLAIVWSLKKFVNLLVCYGMSNFFCHHVMSVIASHDYVELAKTSPKLPKNICLRAVRLTHGNRARRTVRRCAQYYCVARFLCVSYFFTNLVNMVSDTVFFAVFIPIELWPFNASFFILNHCYLIPKKYIKINPCLIWVPSLLCLICSSWGHPLLLFMFNI